MRGTDHRSIYFEACSLAPCLKGWGPRRITRPSIESVPRVHQTWGWWIEVSRGKLGTRQRRPNVEGQDDWDGTDSNTVSRAIISHDGTVQYSVIVLQTGWPMGETVSFVDAWGGRS